MASAEVVVKRRQLMARYFTKPGGFGWHNIDEYRKEASELMGYEPGRLISETTAWDDRNRAEEWLKEHRSVMEPESADDVLAQINTTISEAAHEKNHTAVLKGLDLKTKILGLAAPKQVDVTVKEEAHGVSSLPAQALDVLMVVLGRLEAGTLTGEEIGALRVLGFQAAGELGAPEVIEAEVIEE